MPLGISESLIQRAYAPVDWGNFYKGINDVEKRSLAEIAAERRLSQKQYYTDVAALSKPQKGVREVDLPDILDDVTVYKNNALPLANNPRFIEKDKVKYGEMRSSADKASSNVSSKSLASIDVANQAKILGTRILNDTQSGKGNWKPDAYQTLQENLKKKTPEVIEKGLLDINKYQEQSFNKQEQDDIDKKFEKPTNTILGKVYTRTGDIAEGFNHKVPNINQISLTAGDIVSNIPESKINAEISEKQSYYDNITNLFRNMSEDNFSKIMVDSKTPLYDKHADPDGALNPDGTPVISSKPFFKFDKSNPKQYLTEVLIAQQLIRNQPGRNPVGAKFTEESVDVKDVRKEGMKERFTKFNQRLQQENIRFKAQTGLDMKASDVNQWLEKSKSDQKLFNSITSTAFREGFGRGTNKDKGGIEQIFDFQKQMNEAKGVPNEPSIKSTPSAKPKSDKKFF